MPLPFDKTLVSTSIPCSPLKICSNLSRRPGLASAIATVTGCIRPPSALSLATLVNKRASRNGRSARPFSCPNLKEQQNLAACKFPDNVRGSIGDEFNVAS
jgi:hypothetical protein